MLETLCKKKFIDGIKFVLTSHTTANIYNAMSYESKIVFLNQFLVRMENRLDVEVKEVLYLKLTQEPFSTIALFTMLQLNDEIGLHKVNGSQII